jgi:hypothetical protein
MIGSFKQSPDAKGLRSGLDNCADMNLSGVHYFAARVLAQREEGFRFIERPFREGNQVQAPLAAREDFSRPWQFSLRASASFDAGLCGLVDG